MTGWHRGRLVAFDLETTGVDVETARIVTAAVVRIDVAARTSHPTEWLVDPGIEIPAEASAIHGVTTERARAEGVDPRVAVAEIHHVLVDIARHQDGLGLGGLFLADLEQVES